MRMAIKAQKYFPLCFGLPFVLFIPFFSARRSDADTGPYTPASQLLQKKADTTTPTIQAEFRI
jgi:hypothetical protein